MRDQFESEELELEQYQERKGREALRPLRSSDQVLAVERRNPVGSPSFAHPVITILRLVGVLAALAAAGCASQGRFPNAPILLVCPWAAGGGSDRVARLLATLLEQDLDVPVNVVNVTGGDGVTGHSRGALARNDGYTITLITVEIATLHWRQMTSIGYRDFAPIGLVNRDAAAVFVRSDAPWPTLRSLEQAIRAAPGTLRASGTATAGIWHLALAGWLDAVGLQPADITWVSIAGSAPSLQELMAGGIDIVVCSLAEARPLLNAGRVRSLGVMANERVPQFALVSTLKEQGVDFSLGTIRALAVPRDVAPDRILTLADAVRRVVHSDAYRSSMATGGFTPAYEEPAELVRTLEQTDGRLGALLRSDAFAPPAHPHLRRTQMISTSSPDRGSTNARLAWRSCSASSVACSAWRC